MITFLKNVIVAIGIFIATIFAVQEPEEDIVLVTNPKEIEILEEFTEEPEVEEVVPKDTVETEPAFVEIKESKEDLPVSTEIIDLVVPIPPIVIPIEPTLSVNEVNTKTRDALVNIICTTQQGGLLQPITGSGITIDEKGVILTNAHIAQYFLLKDYIVPNYIDCNIRTGSPARNTYDAELLYISPSWVKENYEQIDAPNPKGTGEDDFALLLITKSIKAGVDLPKKFSFVKPAIDELEPEIGDPVVVAGYPAGFLSGQAIQKDLYAVSTVANVEDVFTFVEKTLDLFSVGGSIAAQKGSSGGGVVNLNAELLGLVVTSSSADQTEDRDLRAVTVSHINRSLQKDLGVSLENHLSGDLNFKANQFQNSTAPELTTLLEEALNN